MRYKNRKPKSVSSAILIRKVLQFFSNNFSIKNTDIQEEVTRVIINIQLNDEVDYDLKELEVLIHRLGWFLDDKFEEWFSDDEFILQFIFESYDAPKIAPERYIYHQTHERNTKEILRKGLIPRRSKGISLIPTGKREDRLYFSNDIDAPLDYPQFDASETSIFEIDTKEIRKGVSFHLDKYEEELAGIWTKSHIPPRALKLLGNVEELREIAWR